LVDYPNIQRLESKPPWDGKRPGKLEPTRAALKALGNPQDAVPAVHVTGTNGKGTVSSIISSALISAGNKVGQFVSPHLHTLNERLLVQGQPVSMERLDQALGEAFEVEKRSEIFLSYFEALIVASHLICAQDNFDYQVVEVGLGGRLDATNLMRSPELTIITSIGLDHTQILGETEREIAFEKAHIFRKGVPAIVGPVSEEAMEGILSASVASKIFRFGEDYSLSKSGVVSSEEWSFQLPILEKNLVAQYQQNNFAVAAYACHLLGIEDVTVCAGISRMRWPGRLERREVEGLDVLLDGAHNSDGFRGLLDYLDNEKKLVIILSVLARKDFSEMGRIFRSWIGNRDVSLFIVPMDSHESAPVEDLQSSFGGEIEASFESAFERAKKVGGLLVVSGSLYFVGEVRAKLKFPPISTYVL